MAITAFEIDYGAKYPKAVAKIVDDMDVLLEFYKYPAEHRVHLRTTNPIESTFAPVRLRTKGDEGSRLESCRLGYGVQADRGCAVAVAGCERTTSRRNQDRVKQIRLERRSPETD